MTYVQVLDRMESEYSSFSPQIRRGAKWILDNPKAVAVTSMRHVASLAKVTPTTMSRAKPRSDSGLWFPPNHLKNQPLGSSPSSPHFGVTHRASWSSRALPAPAKGQRPLDPV